MPDAFIRIELLRNIIITKVRIEVWIEMILKVVVTWLIHINLFLFNELDIASLPATKLVISQQSVLGDKEKYDVIDIVYEKSNY